jgi:hypothetical protein
MKMAGLLKPNQVESLRGVGISFRFRLGRCFLIKSCAVWCGAGLQQATGPCGLRSRSTCPDSILMTMRF